MELKVEKRLRPGFSISYQTDRMPEIANGNPNWASYLRSQMILQEDYSFITTYEKALTKQERDIVLESNLSNGQTVRAFVSLITTVSKDQNVRYVLGLLDEMIEEDHSRVEMFHNAAQEQETTPWTWFLGILQRQDKMIVSQMSCVIAKLACYGSTMMEGSDLDYYIAFLKEQLKNQQNNHHLTSIARCLQMMLRIPSYRTPFLKQNGIQCIVEALNEKTNFQLQYQLTFCLWCLTFDPSIARQSPSLGIIETLGDILSEASKEKVIRIIVATFRNILEKTEDGDVIREAAIQMVQCKTLRTLELIVAKKYEDPEMEDDISFLSNHLLLSIHSLSSFDEYKTELKTGRLHWSPVHKSDKFWKENAKKLNEKNYELIKILIRLLETSSDSLTLCVAAHDIGEYVRHYPRGKNVVEHLNGKCSVMKLLSAEDPNVRYHGLLSIQKLMVHNWEYFGRQFEEEFYCTPVSEQ